MKGTIPDLEIEFRASRVKVIGGGGGGSQAVTFEWRKIGMKKWDSFHTDTIGRWEREHEEEAYILGLLSRTEEIVSCLIGGYVPRGLSGFFAPWPSRTVKAIG